MIGGVGQVEDGKAVREAVQAMRRSGVAATDTQARRALFTERKPGSMHPPLPERHRVWRAARSATRTQARLSA